MKICSARKRTLLQNMLGFTEFDNTMQPQSILIFDQEEVVRDSLQLVLNDEGYNCFTSPEDITAIQLLEQQDISIVILDSEVAVKTDLLKIIKNQYPAIKSVVISSYAALESCQQALIQEADEFILKPLNFDELLSLIRTLIPSVSS